MKLITPFSLPSICRWAGCLLLLSAALLPQAKGANDFVATGSMITARKHHTATLLANGKVLVAGGYDDVTGHVSSAELYDLATGQWGATASLSNARDGHTATLLANGKVLVAGGSDEYNGGLSSAELYDPATGQWSATGPLSAAREKHTATLLANGKVLVAGGKAENDTELSSAELYDPATGQWSATASLAYARSYHTASLLANGQVLVAGGQGDDSSSAELYDPATGRWSTTGWMANARQEHTATLLANGKVLVAGGEDDLSLSSPELYEPATGFWSKTGDLDTTRGSHTATLLANGKVLIAGGESDNEADTVDSAELYQSDSLFSGDYVYSVLNGAATLNAYRGTGGAVTIPSTIGGFPVTSIDNDAFYGNTSLTSVTIPNSVSSIGNQAFYGCTGLTSVTIPNSITSIGNQAFSGCSGLTRVSLPEPFLTDIEYIGLSGQVAATTLIQGVADNLGGNSAFITDFTSAVLAKTGNYGLSTKTDLSDAVAPLASKTELATAVASFASNLDALSANADFVAALASNPAFLTALANQIAAGPNGYGFSRKQNQSLSFPAIPAQTYKAKKTLKLAATSSAKLTPITYASSDPAVATVAGNVVKLVGKGSTAITASQEGNASYNPATAVQVLMVK